jgi:hypothetical protein
MQVGTTPLIDDFVVKLTLLGVLIVAGSVGPAMAASDQSSRLDQATLGVILEQLEPFVKQDEFEKLVQDLVARQVQLSSILYPHLPSTFTPHLSSTLITVIA